MKVGSGPGTDDRKLHREVNSSLNSVGFGENEVKSIWRLMAAILHLGNINFEEDGDSSKITNEAPLNRVAKLLEVENSAAKDALTSRTVSAGGEIIAAQHTQEIAEYGRDAFAKAIYERLFSYIVSRINDAIRIGFGLEMILNTTKFSHFMKYFQKYQNSM